MNRKFVPVLVFLILVMVTLACGGSAPPDEEAEATSPPAGAEATKESAEPESTSPPAGGGEEPVGEYDTVFPLPDDVQNFTGGGGEEGINFQTDLSMDEAIEFYRKALAQAGLTEYPLLTVIEDGVFSMVFTGWPSGEEVVVQGVDMDANVNINVRLEETVDGGDTSAPPPATGGDELRSDMGGYVCQPIPGYTVDEAFGFASMEAPDADPDLGPTVILVGSAAEESSTAEELYDVFMEELEEDINVSEPREITVGGAPGLVVDIDGASEGEEMAGRIVFVAVSPTQQFMMFGAAPPDRWDDELGPAFDAVVDSLAFFEPDLEAGFAEVVSGEEIEQWAYYATASSEYGDFDWAAIQATGEPDTFECGDFVTAWASANGSTVDWLELEYAIPVYASRVNIIQTHSPDQVVTVELIDTEGVYHEIYTGEPQEKSDECPYTLSIKMTKTDYLATGVKITIDQSVIPATWNEIDAVELVGVTE